MSGSHSTLLPTDRTRPSPGNNNDGSSGSDGSRPPLGNSPSLPDPEASFRPPNLQVFCERTLRNQGVITFGCQGLPVYATYYETPTTFSSFRFGDGITVVQHVVAEDFNGLPELATQGTVLKLELDNARREVIVRDSAG
jgi:hypothetical protein